MERKIRLFELHVNGKFIVQKSKSEDLTVYNRSAILTLDAIGAEYSTRQYDKVGTLTHTTVIDIIAHKTL